MQRNENRHVNLFITMCNYSLKFHTTFQLLVLISHLLGNFAEKFLIILIPNSTIFAILFIQIVAIETIRDKQCQVLKQHIFLENMLLGTNKNWKNHLIHNQNLVKNSCFYRT